MNILKGDFVYREVPFLLISSSNGSTIYTEEKKYIDLQAASGSNILGYRNDLLEHILASGQYHNAKPQIMESTTRLKLARKLTEKIYKTNNRHGKVAFELSGAAAIELAIKIATRRKPHLKPLIFTIEACYHGRSIYTSHLSDKYSYRTHHLEFSQQYLLNPAKIMQQHNMSEDEAVKYCILEAQKLIDRFELFTEKSQYFPILIYETIQNVGGGIDLPENYLKFLETIIRQLDGVSIADEIFTALYRVSGFIDTPRKNLTPDIVVLSKGLTNGIVPLSVVWVADESHLSETFISGTHSSTYINSDFTFALANIILDELELIEFPLGEISQFSQIMQKNFSHLFQTTVYRNYGYISLPKEISSKDIRQKMYQTPIGVIVAFTSQSQNRLLMHPAHTITQEEIYMACETLSHSLQNL